MAVLLAAGPRLVRLRAPAGARSLVPSGRLEVEVPASCTCVARV